MKIRPRRLRSSPTLRNMVRETSLSPDQLIQPIFIEPGKNMKEEISSMPGQYRYSVDKIKAEIKDIQSAGVSAVILFGIPKKKDESASGAYAKDGIIQRAVAEIKSATSEMCVITDVCLCEYMSHGHCGIVVKDGIIDNDSTLELIAKTALSHAQAGADMVAPSGMMDGCVAAIRSNLDENKFINTPIMSYSAKYASSFYGPFRDAAKGAPSFGDRRSYQMDPANIREALKEIELDVSEGADIVMIKPALAYLDVIAKVRERCLAPIAAYNVSGEYAMIKAAARNGWIDERLAVLETLTAIRRAGADIIITYFAKEIAQSL